MHNQIEHSHWRGDYSLQSQPLSLKIRIYFYLSLLFFSHSFISLLSLSTTINFVPILFFSYVSVFGVRDCDRLGFASVCESTIHYRETKKLFKDQMSFKWLFSCFSPRLFLFRCYRPKHKMLKK